MGLYIYILILTYYTPCVEFSNNFFVWAFIWVKDLLLICFLDKRVFVLFLLFCLILISCNIIIKTTMIWKKKIGIVYLLYSFIFHDSRPYMNYDHKIQSTHSLLTYVLRVCVCTYLFIHTDRICRLLVCLYRLEQKKARVLSTFSVYFRDRLNKEVKCSWQIFGSKHKE